jgi:hypothetical protein
MKRIQKPKVKLIGKDGNVFNLLGLCTSELKKKGLRNQATELTNKVFSAGSYEDALVIMGEYVTIT